MSFSFRISLYTYKCTPFNAKKFTTASHNQPEKMFIRSYIYKQTQTSCGVRYHFSNCIAQFSLPFDIAILFCWNCCTVVWYIFAIISTVYCAHSIMILLCTALHAVALNSLESFYIFFDISFRVYFVRNHISFVLYLIWLMQQHDSMIQMRKLTHSEVPLSQIDHIENKWEYVAFSKINWT